MVKFAVPPRNSASAFSNFSLKIYNAEAPAEKQEKQDCLTKYRCKCKIF